MAHAKLLAVLAASLVSAGALADRVTDAHGNEGYDTAAECDAAVHSGTANFYQVFTRKPALKRKGEKTVGQGTIRELGPEYQYGACDLGVGRKFGREGVARALQGKYVPYSPDMPLNVYADASGATVRVSMQQCDNRFSDNLPRPVAAPPAPAPAPEPAPEPAAPAPEPEKPRSSVRPYVFGTLGAVRDGIREENGYYVNDYDRLNSHSTRFGGQVGVGVQFNNIVGLEAFYQGGARHKVADSYVSYNPVTNSYGVYDDSYRYRNNTYGARVTLGSDIGSKARLFGKVGAAAVRHSIRDTDGGRFSETKVRPTVGVGALYKFTDNVALRADYDYYFKKKVSSDGDRYTLKGVHYLGAGVQYTF